MSTTLWIDSSKVRRHNLSQSPRPEICEILGPAGVGKFDDDPIGVLDQLASHSEAWLREGGDFLLRRAARLGDPDLLAFLLDYRFNDIPTGEAPRRVDALKGLRIVAIEDGECAPDWPMRPMPHDLALQCCVSDLVSGGGKPVACLDVLVDRVGTEQLRIPVRSVINSPGSMTDLVGHQTLLMHALVQSRHDLAARILVLDPQTLNDRTSDGYCLDDLIDFILNPGEPPWFKADSVCLIRAAQAAQRAREVLTSMSKPAAREKATNP